MAKKKVDISSERWTAFEEYAGWAVKVVESKPSIGTLYVCREINQGHDGGEAHAKLIAAAPDLLLAVQSIFDVTKGKPIGSTEYNIHMACYNAIKKLTI